MKLVTSEWLTLDHDPSARFHVRGLTGLEVMEITQEMANNMGAAAMKALKDGKVPLTPGMLRIVMRAVENWDGVAAEDGAPIPFSPAARDRLDTKAVQALAAKILDKTFVSEDAEKNS